MQCDMVTQSTEKAVLKGSIVVIVIVIQHGGMQQLKVTTTMTNIFVRQQPVVSLYRFIVTNV
jgi:hypothetical protein